MADRCISSRIIWYGMKPIPEYPLRRKRLLGASCTGCRPVLCHDSGAVQRKLICEEAEKVLGLYKIRNLYLRTLLRLFRNPDAIRYLVSHMLQVRKGAYQPAHQQKGFLDNPEFGKEKQSKKRIETGTK